MAQPVIYVFTHDSIWVGEDGPTHQPIEQLESLRLIPNLKVIRPADSEEVKASWKVILERREGPTALILSRQNLPKLNKKVNPDDLLKGGYIINKSKKKIDVTISASGSEVQIALQVKDILENNNIVCRVVSIPDREAFARQNRNYREKVLGGSEAFQVVIEAATGQGWYEIIPELSIGLFIRRFGESGPGDEVARKAGLDPEKIARKILLLKRT